MTRYRVAQVGCGGRGKVHLDGWLKTADRFELVAVCDLDEQKMKAAVESRSIFPSLYTDADKMLSETQPDVFCFSTPPDVRLPLVELAGRHPMKGLVFEKPMATSLKEAWEITRICREHGIKAAVSHQQKYLTSFQKLKQVLDAGEIGEIVRIDASCRAWLLQLGTHYVDYVLWANGGHRALWVVGHVHGKELLANSHPSPDYCLGQIAFENGVRSYVEFGYLSLSNRDDDAFWLDSRLTAYGTHGYVWCDTDGRWGALTPATSGRPLVEQGEKWNVQESTTLQPLFARDFAAWLDDDGQTHPCNLEITYHGYEIMEALCLSGMNHCRVDLPLDPAKCEDIFARMRRELPECPKRADL